MTVREPALDDNLPFLADIADGRPTDVAVAERIAQRCDGRVVHVDGAFFDWTGKRWRRLPPGTIARYIQRLDGRRTVRWPRETLILNVNRIAHIEAMLAQLLGRAHFFDHVVLGINAENGLVVFDEDGTPALIPHSPEHRQRSVVPAPWDAKAEAGPAWRRLHEACGSHPLIAELVGVAATGGTRLIDHRMVLVLDPSRKVRGELATVLRGVATDRCGAVNTFEMDDNDRLATLQDCVINVTDEAGDEPMPRALYAMLADAPVTLASSRRSRAVQLSVLHIVMADAPPRLFAPLSPSLARRVAQIELLDRDIRGTANTILTNEARGLLNVTVHAVSRLVATRSVTEPTGSVEAISRWSRGLDVIALFLELEGIDRSAAANLTVTRLHERYTEWATANRMPLLTPSKFLAGVRRAGDFRWLGRR
jgi:hypothetical protein